MKTILAYFHYGGKGSHPFTMASDSAQFKDFVTAAGLSVEQTALVHRTVESVKRASTHRLHEPQHSKLLTTDV